MAYGGWNGGGLNNGSLIGNPGPVGFGNEMNGRLMQNQPMQNQIMQMPNQQMGMARQQMPMQGQQGSYLLRRQQPQQQQGPDINGRDPRIGNWGRGPEGEMAYAQQFYDSALANGQGDRLMQMMRQWAPIAQNRLTAMQNYQGPDVTGGMGPNAQWAQQNQLSALQALLAKYGG